MCMSSRQLLGYLARLILPESQLSPHKNQKTLSPEEEYKSACLLTGFVVDSLPALASNAVSRHSLGSEGHRSDTRSLAEAIDQVAAA